MESRRVISWMNPVTAGWSLVGLGLRLGYFQVLSFEFIGFFQSMGPTDSRWHAIAESALGGYELHGNVGVGGGDLSGDFKAREPRANHHDALGGGDLRACEEERAPTPLFSSRALSFSFSSIFILRSRRVVGQMDVLLARRGWRKKKQNKKRKDKNDPTAWS